MAQQDELTHYEVLGIELDASSTEVKRAYRKLALQHHPDKAPASQKRQATATFQRISLAYETLIDEKQRQQYDLEISRIDEQDYWLSDQGHEEVDEGMPCSGKGAGVSNNTHAVPPQKTHIPPEQSSTSRVGSSYRPQPNAYPGQAGQGNRYGTAQHHMPQTGGHSGYHGSQTSHAAHKGQYGTPHSYEPQNRWQSGQHAPQTRHKAHHDQHYGSQAYKSHTPSYSAYQAHQTSHTAHSNQYHRSQGYTPKATSYPEHHAPTASHGAPNTRPGVHQSYQPQPNTYAGYASQGYAQHNGGQYRPSQGYASQSSAQYRPPQGYAPHHGGYQGYAAPQTGWYTYGGQYGASQGYRPHAGYSQGYGARQ